MRLLGKFIAKSSALVEKDDFAYILISLSQVWKVIWSGFLVHLLFSIYVFFVGLYVGELVKERREFSKQINSTNETTWGNRIIMKLWGTRLFFIMHLCLDLKRLAFSLQRKTNNFL